MLISSMTGYRPRDHLTIVALRKRLKDGEDADLVCTMEDVFINYLTQAFSGIGEINYEHSLISWEDDRYCILDIAIKGGYMGLGIPLSASVEYPADHPKMDILIDRAPLNVMVSEYTLNSLQGLGISLLDLLNEAVPICTFHNVNEITESIIAMSHFSQHMAERIAQHCGYTDGHLVFGDKDAEDHEAKYQYLRYETFENMYLNALYGVAWGYYLTLRTIQAEMFTMIGNLSTMHQINVRDMRPEFISYTVVGSSILLTMGVRRVVCMT